MPPSAHTNLFSLVSFLLGMAMTPENKASTASTMVLLSCLSIHAKLQHMVAGPHPMAKRTTGVKAASLFHIVQAQCLRGDLMYESGSVVLHTARHVIYGRHECQSCYGKRMQNNCGSTSDLTIDQVMPARDLVNTFRGISRWHVCHRTVLIKPSISQR